MTTKLKTELTVDPAVELSSRFFLDAKDRRYLDDQIRALSSYFVQGHLRGSLRSYFKLDLDSDPLDPGDVFVSAGTAATEEADPDVAVRLVTKATPDALEAAGAVLGVAIEACAPGGYFPGAIDGLLGPSVTGLVSGAPKPVRVSSSARCEAVASLVDGDYVVGFKDAAGNLTIARGGLGGGGSGVLTPTQVTTSRSAELTDATRFLLFNSASPLTFTIEPDSAVNFPLGTVLQFSQEGVGQLTIVAGSGVTIRSSETLKLRKQDSGGELRKVAANSWRLFGDLELT